MSILYLLIPLAVGLMAIAIAFFIWSVRTGQYDDLEGPAYRVLLDDDNPRVVDPKLDVAQSSGDARSAGSVSDPPAKSSGGRSSEGGDPTS